MGTWLRQVIVAAGPFRQALLILVVGGTIFNAWTAIEAQSALPDYTAKVTHDVRLAANLEVTLRRVDPQSTPNPELSSEEAIQQTIRREVADDYSTYVRPRFNAIWEQAAKVEFGILVGGLILWLVLPRSKHAT